jgi:hypothetical protein
MVKIIRGGGLWFVLLTKYYRNDQNNEDWIGGECGMHGGNRNTHRVLDGKTEGKGPVGKPKLRCEANI